MISIEKRLIFVFIFIIQSFAEVLYYKVPYSVLFNIDDDLVINISKADSLVEISIDQFDKLIKKDTCSILGFPNMLFNKLSLDKQYKLFWEYGHSKNLNLYYSDSLYEEQCSNQIDSINVCIVLRNPTIKEVDKCSLHFSSETLQNDEQIILINDTPYYIAKRKDGSTVLRKNTHLKQGERCDEPK